MMLDLRSRIRALRPQVALFSLRRLFDRVPVLVAVLVTQLLVPNGSNAQDCIDYEEFAHHLGSVAVARRACDVAVSEPYAYVALQDRGLQIIDISDKRNPTIVGWLQGIRVEAVEVSSTYVYASQFNLGLEIIDVSNPASPVPVRHFTTPGWVRNVEIRGNLAYVADYTAGLTVLDVSEPTSPRVIGSVDIPGAAAYALHLEDQYAYVATGSTGGLQIVDIGDPRNPRLLGSVATPGDALEVVVTGDHAYVADGFSGTNGFVEVIDVSSPAAPVRVRTLTLSGRPSRITATGSHLFVGALDLEIFDLSCPANPAHLGKVDVPTAVENPIVVSGPYAYVTGGDAFHIIDISNPTPVTIRHNVPILGLASSVVTARGYAYVAARWGNLKIVDISEPLSATVIGGLSTQEIAHQVVVRDTDAYVVYGLGFTSSLGIVDVSNPRAPVVRGRLNTAGNASGLAVQGNFAYIVGTAGLEVIDISTPLTPRLISTTPPVGSGYRTLVVQETYAFIAAGSGLLMFDVSDPQAPTLVSSLPIGSVTWVHLRDGNAYLVTSSELVVVDVTNPLQPVRLGSVATPGGVGEVTVHENVAYVGDGVCGLQLVDVSNPRVPRLIGSVATPSAAGGIAVRGYYAFVADFESGLQVVPAQCKTIPVLVSELSATPFDGSILLTWRTATNEFASFEVLRAAGDRPESGPFEPIGAASPRPSPNEWEFLDRGAPTEGRLAYRIAGRTYDGRVLEFGPVTAEARLADGVFLGPARPSPARDVAQVDFALPRRLRIALDVYDVFGRRVRDLADGVRPAGRHTIAWDGRDDAGTRLPAGVYFVRLQWPGGTRVTRAVLVR